jgi:hypothetical protein
LSFSSETRCSALNGKKISEQQLDLQILLHEKDLPAIFN